VTTVVAAVGRPTVLPRSFLAWLGAATLSTYGDSALYFALGWTATGIGARWAGLVVTMITLPRTVLLLVGGAVGDRWGPRRVMICGDAVMCVVTLLLALLAQVGGVTGWLLLSTGLAVGIVDAFYLPSTGSFPRLFVDDDQLPRALALKGSFSQTISLVGGPLSGVLVTVAGLIGAALVDAATFAVVLGVLLVVRPRHEAPRQAGTGSLRRDALDGLRLVRTDPLLRALLAAVAIVAAFVLPVASMSIPLIARSHSWGASSAGVLVGGTVLGSLSVTLLVARRGASGSPTLVAAIGLLVAAAGMATLAVSSELPLSTAAAVAQGVGTGLFATRVGSLLLTSTPRSHLARVQSLVSVVQAAPLLLSANLLGAIADATGIETATMTCAVGTAVAAALLLRTPGPPEQRGPRQLPARAWKDGSR
jgi:MFS family permease